jgi:DNA-binding XRE family transcriptional regulator
MPVQTMTIGGQEGIFLPRQEYEDLIDARDHAQAMADVRAGAETFTDAELGEYLAAPSPLAFWRKRRGLTQAALATTTELSQGYLAQIETGRRTGTVDAYARLAKALGVRIEDLVAEG